MSRPASCAVLLSCAAVLLAASPPRIRAQAAGAWDEVRTLMEHATIQEAFRHIEENDAWTIATLRELTEIPAPPFMEEVRGRRFLELLQASRVDSAWVDEVGNVIGLRRGGGSGTMIVSGHLDTVFPEGTDVRIRESGDTLFAPGIADDSRGLVAVPRGAAGHERRRHPDGAGHLVRGHGGRGRHGRSARRQASVPRGLARFRRVHLDRRTGPQRGDQRRSGLAPVPGLLQGARAGTPGGRSGLGNPIHALGRAVAAFDAAAKRYTDNAAPRTSYNVGTVRGGTSVNSIPFEAWMEIDMRFRESRGAPGDRRPLPRRRCGEGLEEANEARARGEELTLEITMIGNRPSGEIPDDHPFIQRALAATELLGGTASLRRSSTDSNTPIALDIPAITIGGGGAGGNAHSLAEFFMNQDGPLGIQRALLILVSGAGLVPVM